MRLFFATDEMENIVGYKNYQISIFDYVPEINQENKKLITHKEIYETLFRFTCNDMLFINLTRVAPVNSSGKYNSIKSKREFIEKDEPTSPKSNKSRGD